MAARPRRHRRARTGRRRRADDDDDGDGGERRRRRSRRSSAADGGARRRPGGRRAEGDRGRRHRLHGPRRGVLPVHLHGHDAGHSAACSPGSRTTSRSRRPTSPTEEPGDLRGREDDHLHDPRRRPLQPARRPRGRPRRTSSTRSSARCCRACQRLRRRPTWPTSRASRSAARRPRTTRPAARRTSAGITAPDDTTLVIKLDRADLGVVDAGAVAAGQRPGAGGVREGVRRREPVDLRPARGRSPARTWSRTTRDRRAHRLHARQGDQPGPQPELGRRGHGDYRPGLPGRDHVPGGLRRHGLGVAEDPRRRRARSTATSRRRRLCSRRPRPGRRGGPADADAERRQPLHRAQHPAAAVRRHQRPQGGDRELGPGRRCATRAAASWSGQVATHYIRPGFPGFEEAGGVEGPDLDFIAKPDRRSGARRRVHEEGRVREREVRGSDCEIAMVGDDVPPGKDTAEVFRASSRSSGSRSASSRSTTRSCTRGSAASRSTQPEVCPNVGWIKDFRDPQSMLDVTFYGDEHRSPRTTPTGLSSTTRRSTRRSRRPAGRDPEERAEAWGEVDTPGHRRPRRSRGSGTTRPMIQSANVAGVINLFNASWDLALHVAEVEADEDG